jgi:hypothetical protein
VPAAPSSLMPAVLNQLTHLPDRHQDPPAALDRVADLREHLAAVPDPRDRRGIRHTVTTILLIATAAVLGGAHSFTAIGEWAADLPNTCWPHSEHAGTADAVSTAHPPRRPCAVWWDWSTATRWTPRSAPG